ARSRQFRSAVSQVRHAWKDAFAHRRQKKRNFRKLWITRINAGARQHGISYSKLIHALKSKDIQIDRKVLADLAMNEPAGFKAVVDAAR
ncbi:MAG: 50S ribosomal protein L20, partial [Myxococcales bacterium]|nr:50S ribosomal protein L20 [Myxococcales bacterium]